ncbi:uncharacterized protein N7496_000384 [Penicillium cataractarum]|uniref:Cytochrome P450 n=1 Tax=Penicillium cataractarum TaxID=2100454 RepID=A0A9X0B5Z5_9EURO|nr:uncharacterized protein N7496_000384 [Penicillium cataractarum]KAJ5389316.1 hypothetical protein N7496_000384 [Penicillium cataractarum]
MIIRIWQAIWLLVGGFLLHRLCLVIYRVFLHPLRAFPGPKLYAASYLPYLYQNKIAGTFVKYILRIHEIYGPVIRISPNHLAIDGSIGWSEVFARHSNVPEFEKTPTFYGPRNGIGILPARQEDHQRQRRLIAYAFSPAALAEQESYLKYYIDLLMKRLRERMLTGDPVDMARWYNYLTFDIIAELAFADPFNCLEKSDCHPLVSMIFSGIRGNAHISFFEQYPVLRPLVNFMATKDDMEKRRQYYAMARAKTEKRITLGADTRKDFMTYILRNNKDGTGMTHEEILANTRTLIGAGSHTTASALAGLTFYLTKSPEVYSRLTGEIRSTFSSEDDINMKSTAALPYLHACLEEALRIYPPLAETPPRVSPGAFVNGQYIPKGVRFFGSSSFKNEENILTTSTDLRIGLPMGHASLAA